MDKVVIVQNRIPHYRVAIYSLLGKKLHLSVCHSGKNNTEQETFRNIQLKDYKLGPFIIQKGLLETCYKNNVVIAMFDIRWISSIYALYMCKKKNIKFYWWGHGFGKNRILNKLRVWLAKKADGIILYSAASIDSFVKGGIDRNKIFVANNTIDIPNHGFSRTTKKDSFLFVGQLRKIKRLEELLTSFAEIVSIPKYTFLKLNIIGEGPELANYQKLANELGLTSAVNFKGRITDHLELKKYFQRSLAYVSPGDVGLGVLHSFAYGIPVITRNDEIAYHGPEFHNIQHEINGYLYDGTIAGLKKSISYFADNPNLSIELGKNAYAHYKESRQIKHMVEGFTNILILD